MDPKVSMPLADYPERERERLKPKYLCVHGSMFILLWFPNFFFWLEFVTVTEIMLFIYQFKLINHLFNE